MNSPPVKVWNPLVGAFYWTPAGAFSEVRNVRVEAGGRRVLDDVCLQIAAREVHALVGANGAGKSTLARLLMGCGEPMTRGSVRFDGEEISRLPMQERSRRGIALSWQEPAWFEGLSIQAFLGLGRSKRDPADCLRRVGLEPADYLDRPLDARLSGGERKRIELAGVLALEPRLAILDEPAASKSFRAPRSSSVVVPDTWQISHWCRDVWASWTWTTGSRWDLTRWRS